MSSITPGLRFPTRITVTSNFVVTASLVSQPGAVYVADTYTRSTNITGTLPSLSSVTLGGVVRLEQRGVYLSSLSASGNDPIGYDAPRYAISTIARADTYALPVATSASISATSTVVYSPVSGAFSVNDEGLWIAISGAGTAGGMFSTTVVSYSAVGFGQFTIASAAPTTSTSAQVFVQRRSIMGTAGDTRARVLLTTEERILGGVWSTSVFVSGMTGSASVTALNGTRPAAFNYQISENYAQTYLFLNDTSLSSGAIGSSGTLAIARQNITLISPDNYVELMASVDSDNVTRRWIVQGGTLETIGQGRDVGWGFLGGTAGYGTDLSDLVAPDFYYAGKTRRPAFRTHIEAEFGDGAEIMIGRWNGVYPYGTIAQTLNNETIGIIWSRRGNNTGQNLFDGRNSLITFKAAGNQTSSNAAGRLWFGNTYSSTSSDRRSFVFLDEFTNILIADVSDALNNETSGSPRFAAINSLQSSGSGAVDQTVGLFWAQSTAQTRAVTRIRGTTSTSSYRLTQWEAGATGQHVLAYITALGAGAIDTSWTSPASDIAEWKVPWWDGNPKMEDRRARTVVFVDADNLDKPIRKGPKGVGPKSAKLRLWNSFDPPIPLEFICGVTTSNPAFAMGAAPLRYHGQFAKDRYGTPLWEEADYVEWTVMKVEAINTAQSHKYTRQARIVGGFVDDGFTPPEPSHGDLNQIIIEAEAKKQRLEDFEFIFPATYSKQWRPVLNKNFDPSLEEGYVPRPERAEWFRAGITEKGMVPLHDDEPILDSWWVLGEAGPGLIWVSI